MKTISILRTACAALLFTTGLTAAQAQGVRVHYNNGDVVDIPAALFDHMSPGLQKATPEEEEESNFTVEPLDITAQYVNTVREAGMPIYTGTSAPTINGTYSLKPAELVKYWSVDPEDYNDIEIDEDVEMVLKFMNQSGNYVWLDTYDVDEDGPGYAMGESSELGTKGLKSYITGSGNKFTTGFVYTFDWSQFNFFTRIAYIFSAEVSGGNLKDLYIAAISLDRNNNIEEYGIGKDRDGVSYATTWAPKPYSDEWDSRKVGKMTRRLLPKKATTEKDTYYYTIYKTDGTELTVTQDELDYVETYEAEFDQRITQQIPQEYLEKMSAHMPIYSGSTPPTIDGVFVMSPLVLGYSSDGYTTSGYFADTYIRFRNQNFTKNTIQYQDKEGVNAGDETEMVVLGQGDNFTVFAVVPGYQSTTNVSYKLATIVSGTMTESGIKDCYRAIVMVDKDDPENKVMKVGTYRIFKDEDGLSSPTSWSSRSAVREGSGVGGISIMAAE